MTDKQWLMALSRQFGLSDARAYGWNVSSSCKLTPEVLSAVIEVYGGACVVSGASLEFPNVALPPGSGKWILTKLAKAVNLDARLLPMVVPRNPGLPVTYANIAVMRRRWGLVYASYDESLSEFLNRVSKLRPTPPEVDVGKAVFDKLMETKS